MQAADLRARIGFFKRVVPPASGADIGVPEGDYPPIAEFECAANIRPRLGGESILADRLTGVNAVNITVRQSSNTKRVDVSWRAKDQRTGTFYNIRSVIDPYEGSAEHGRWIEMLCERGVAT